MKLQAFDLNDIAHEPSDEQLDALMEAVVVEVRKHAEAAREQLMFRLRAEITAMNMLPGYRHDRGTESTRVWTYASS